jgi:hypothetical protein
VDGENTNCVTLSVRVSIFIFVGVHELDLGGMITFSTRVNKT